MNVTRVRSLLVVLGFAALPALAHPALEARIAELTRRIAANPADASLLVERAGVHRDHEDWAAAKKDLDVARAIEPHLAGLDLATGLLLLDAGDPRAALAPLDAAVARDARDVPALTARGHALALVGEPERAAEAFGQAIAAVPKGALPQPDLYVQRATLLLSIQPDTTHAHAQAALATLTDGISRLGPILTLVLPAIDVETRLGRNDAALERLDGARLPTMERLVLRGEVLRGAGRAADSRAAFVAARHELERAGRRPSPLDGELRQRIERGLVATP